jgi:putative FmdB family regulatory protein
MPLYEFDCLNCGESFEKLVRNINTVDKVICPTCKLSVFATNVKGGLSIPASAFACAPGGT